MKRFYGICLTTRDVRRLCDFYSAALQTPVEGDDTFAVVSTEGAGLVIYSAQGTEEMAPGSMTGAGQGSTILEFRVDDVDAEYEWMVKLGAPVVKPPATYPWGLRSAWFRDPNGNILNFNAPVSGAAAEPVKKEAGALVREYFQRLINERDLSVCDELLSAGYVDHDTPEDTPPGPRNTRAYVAQFLADYPDMRVEIEDLVAEGNRVAARMVWHGSHRLAGELFHEIGLVMLRIDDQGKLAERWSAYRSPP